MGWRLRSMELEPLLPPPAESVPFGSLLAGVGSQVDPIVPGASLKTLETSQ